MALSELTERELRQLLEIGRDNGAGAVKSISAVFDSGAEDWKVTVEVINGQSSWICCLVEKRGSAKGFKSLTALAVRLRKMGAKELLLKLDG